MARRGAGPLIGRNLLQRGDITGWDGRNLVGGTNGRTLNAELRDVLPPLTYVLNAAGARIMPALIGILSLGLLYLLLRQHLAHQPRLVFFCLLFAAWSPCLLLRALVAERTDTGSGRADAGGAAGVPQPLQRRRCRVVGHQLRSVCAR